MASHTACWPGTVPIFTSESLILIAPFHLAPAEPGTFLAFSSREVNRICFCSVWAPMMGTRNSPTSGGKASAPFIFCLSFVVIDLRKPHSLTFKFSKRQKSVSPKQLSHVDFHIYGEYHPLHKSKAIQQNKTKR